MQSFNKNSVYTFADRSAALGRAERLSINKRYEGEIALFLFFFFARGSLSKRGAFGPIAKNFKFRFEISITHEGAPSFHDLEGERHTLSLS